MTFGASSNGTINSGDEVFQIIKSTDASTGAVSWTLKTYDKDGNFVNTTPVSMNTSGSTISFSYNYVDEDGSSTTVEFKDIPNVFNGASASNFTIKEVQPLDVDTMQQTAQEILFIMSGILQKMNSKLRQVIHQSTMHLQLRGQLYHSFYLVEM